MATATLDPTTIEHATLFPPKPAAAEANNPVPTVAEVVKVLEQFAKVDKARVSHIRAERAAYNAGLLERAPLTARQKQSSTSGRYTQWYLQITPKGLKYLGKYRLQTLLDQLPNKFSAADLQAATDKALNNPDTILEILEHANKIVPVASESAPPRYERAGTPTTPPTVNFVLVGAPYQVAPGVAPMAAVTASHYALLDTFERRWCEDALWAEHVANRRAQLLAQLDTLEHHWCEDALAETARADRQWQLEVAI